MPKRGGDTLEGTTFSRRLRKISDGEKPQKKGNNNKGGESAVFGWGEERTSSARNIPPIQREKKESLEVYFDRGRKS